MKGKKRDVSLERGSAGTGKGEHGAVVTPEQIEAFLEHLSGKSGKSCTEGTVIRYRHNLTMLYDALPEDKQIRRGTLAQWREQLLEEGYAVRTVNVCISAANSFLDYLGLREFQLADQMKPGEESQPELTRTEYLRLLQTARVLGRERVYLMVKLFGSTGLPVQELSKVTVEAVKTGRVTISPSGIEQVVRIPEYLKQELLDFAERTGRLRGPLFVTRDGKPLCRTNVSSAIHQLCGEAQVAPEKGNPRCLKRLYQSTRQGIEANINLLVEQAHDRIMETEQLTIGWRQNETGNFETAGNVR